MEKKIFKSLIPRALRKRAEMAWRNNSPTIVPLDEEDKTKAFLMNKLVKIWWKEGGHKKVLKKILKNNP